MTLITSSHAKKLRIQLFLLLFITFIIYCIYTISNNVPAITKQFDNIASDTSSSVTEEDTEQNIILLPVTKVAENICTTNAVLRNVDPNHTNAHFDFWVHLTDNTINTYKRRWQRFISNMKQTKIPTQDMRGQGIVFIAGNRDTFHRALTSIKLLRKYKCVLDIEIWHLHDEQPTHEMKKELLSLNALARDLSDSTLPKPISVRRGAEKQ